MVRCVVCLLGGLGGHYPCTVVLYTAPTDASLCIAHRYSVHNLTDASNDWLVHSVQHRRAAAHRLSLHNSRQPLSRRLRIMLSTMALPQRENTSPLLASRLLDNLRLDMVPRHLPLTPGLSSPFYRATQTLATARENVD